MVYATALEGSLLNADLSDLITTNLSLVNDFGTSSSATFGVTDPTGLLESTDPNATATIPGYNGGLPFDVTYAGAGTFSTANINLLLGTVVVTVNPVPVGVFQDDLGNNFILSEQPLDAANLTATATVLGIPVGPLSLSALVGAINALTVLGDITLNDILNAVVFDLDTIDPLVDYQLDPGEFTVVCFVEGTLIATPEGERLVEDLAIGDLVLTVDGKPVAVKWIGRQQVHARTGGFALSEKMLPVCISAGALGNGLPHTDLYVSAGHGMIVDNLVVNAGALVNGSTIRFVTAEEFRQSFCYYHIETENHDVVLANGAASETFVDYIGRMAFDNYQEYVDLYGSDRLIGEMPRLRISSRRQLPAHLAERFGISSFSRAVEDDFVATMKELAAA